MSGILNYTIKYLGMSGFMIGISFKKILSQTIAKAPSLEFYYIKSANLETSWHFVQYQSTAAAVVDSSAAYGVYRQFGPIPPYLDLRLKLLRR